MRFEIVDPTPAHAEDLAARMRQGDRAEVLASGGYQPVEAVSASLECSALAFTALIDGEVAAIFGVTPLDEPGTGVVWMLTTDTVDKHPTIFLRNSVVALRGLLDKYSKLVNLIDARHLVAIRWAAWAGFKVGAPVLFGAAQLPFCPILLEA